MKAALLANSGLVPAGVILAMAAESVDELETRIEELRAECETLQAADDGDISDENMAKIEANVAEIDKLQRRVTAQKKLDDLKAGAGRKTSAEPQNRDGSQRRVVPATVRDSARHGFQSFGMFAQAVRGHYGGVESDDVNKLRNAATTYSSEGTGADGGFLVPPEFSSQIWQKVLVEENLMNRCATLVTGTNSMVLPKDETTPWQTTGGVQVYWGSEAGTITQSKAAFEQDTFRLHKLFALVPVTEELLSDGVGLQSWLSAKAPAKMAARINTAIVAGTGVGQPLGIIPGYGAVGTSVIQVSKATSQPADTIWFRNINDMWGRMYAPWRRNAIWLVNQDLEAQLAGMAFQANGAASLLPGTSAVPAYLPMNGLSTSPYATLMGRPVVPVEACSAIGDLGDIILADLNQYWVLTKAGGIQTDTSIHLFFDQAITAFRFIFRINGQPAWSDTIARQNGNNTLSWAVALQAR